MNVLLYVCALVVLFTKTGSAQLFEVLGIESQASALAGGYTEHNATTGHTYGSLVDAKTPSDVNLVISYIKEAMASTQHRLGNAFANAKSLADELESQEQETESSALAKNEPLKLLQCTAHVTIALLAALKQLGFEMSAILSANTVAADQQKVVGKNNSDIKISVKDVKTLGGEAEAIQKLLMSLLTDIKQLKSYFVEIQTGASDLGLSQFGIKTSAEFTAAEMELKNITSGLTQMEGYISTIANNFKQTDFNGGHKNEIKSLAATVKNYVAPMIYTILEYYKTGKDAYSLNKNLHSIATDMAFA